MLEEELSEALSRPRQGRRKLGEDEAAPSVVGVRHGHRERTLTGAFGKTRIAVPRARLTGEDGKTREWRSGSLRACQRRTRAADALIAGAYLAGAYLAGTNTRRVRGALNGMACGEQDATHLCKRGVSLGSEQGKDESRLGLNGHRPTISSLALGRYIACRKRLATHRIALDAPTLKCAAA